MLNRRALACAGLGVGMGASLLGGCTLSPDEDHAGADAPRAMPLARPVRTAWVFSSGGPRGFVHVGVVKALSEMGLAPDLLVGASIGSAVAVMVGCGKSARDIEQLALELKPLSLGRIAIGGSARLSGAAISDMVRNEVSGLLLERMRIPVVCVAARMADGRLMGFNAGDAGLAVQASCAIEGQFNPVRIRGEQYVDADLYQPLPVRVARQLGATRVLAVDASAHEDRAPASAVNYRAGDLRKRALTEPDARAADLTLHPEFGYYVNLSREFRETAINAGYRSTMALAKQLTALHAIG
jgi:NTE family protein